MCGGKAALKTSITPKPPRGLTSLLLRWVTLGASSVYYLLPTAQRGPLRGLAAKSAANLLGGFNLLKSSEKLMGVSEKYFF